MPTKRERYEKKRYEHDEFLRAFGALAVERVVNRQITDANEAAQLGVQVGTIIRERIPFKTVQIF